MRIFGLALITLIGCATARPPQQTAGDMQARAVAAFDKGTTHFAASRWGEALTAFELARERAWAPLSDVAIARTLDRMDREPWACRYWVERADTRELMDEARKGTATAIESLKEVGARSTECLSRGLGFSYPAFGPTDALVTVVEFSDFQCPFCKRVQPTLKQLAEHYPAQVRFVFMHNPLAFHKQALPAARAALAAHRQGRFFDMREKLFEHQRNLTREQFVTFARELNLDTTRFVEDMDEPGTEAHIRRQMATATALGARGTPGFFINGKHLSGAQPFDRFVKEIDAAIANARAELEKGTSRARLHEVLAARNSQRYVDTLIHGKDPPKTAPPKATRPTRPPATGSKEVWKVPVSAADAAVGPADALVTIVEFSEFQCPFCSRVVPTLKQIEKTYGKDVRLVFKHNPLPFHKQARAAAWASMAAQEQGKFWQMHDLLFEQQRNLTRDNFLAMAEKLGLHTRRFTKAFDAGAKRYDPRINADQALAGSVNARGTPNFFINGRSMRGAQPFERFKALIDEELVKARALAESGTPRSKVYEKTISGGKTFSALKDEVHTFTLKGRPAFGPKNAKVTVTVFSDYQCPFCKRLDAQVRGLISALPGKVRVVFKQFPLAFHKQADRAARAALAAHKQNKFGAMHDLLYEDARNLTPESFLPLARKARLKTRRFEKDMKGDTVRDMLALDMQEGRKAGVRGTPSLFINGRLWQGSSRDTSALADAIRKTFLK